MATWYASATNVAETIDYGAFGEPAHSGSFLQANNLVHLHACREFDDFSQLHYNRARWYDPSMGRFISEDPLGFAGGDTNLYRYVFNSPANGTDPSGEFADWLLNFANDGENIYGVIPVDSFVGRGYAGAGDGFRGMLGDEYLMHAGSWELLGLTIAAATASVLTGAAAPGLIGVGATSWAGVAIAGAAAGAAEYSVWIGGANLGSLAGGRGWGPAPTVSGFAAHTLGGAVGGVALKGVGQFAVGPLLRAGRTAGGSQRREAVDSGIITPTSIRFGKYGLKTGFNAIDDAAG